MIIVAVGLNHRVAPIELRERLSFRPDEMPAALAALRGYASEGALLSTCNRTEVYGLVGHSASGQRSLAHFLSDSRRVPLDEFLPHLYVHVQEGAVAHLFRVACGLDSMVVGEPQILGQVREAYEAARSAGTAGTVIGRLFQHAIEVGKRARTETEISRNAVSVSSVAVGLAQRCLGDLAGRTVLVIGAGEMGKATARSLVGAGASRLLVASRTLEHAAALAGTVGGQALALGGVEAALVDADIVISSTAAPGYVLDYETVRRAHGARGGRPLLLVDIAVPRDVDPAVATLPNVHLYNVDDLQALSEANLREREREAQRVETMLAAEVPRFKDWWYSREVVPTISALLDWAESVRREEVAKAVSRLGGLSAREVETIEAMSSAIVNKLLHHPIVRLKAQSGDGSAHEFAHVVRELFPIRVETSHGA
ncbi:MAG TPA: glutamyl-tRNA reductase [Chloroflexota bacterium]